MGQWITDQAAWDIVHAMGASKRKEKKKDVLKLK